MKKAISIMLALTLLCMTTVSVFADDLTPTITPADSIDASAEVLTNAVKSLDSVFDENQTKGIIAIIKDFAQSFKSATSYASAINSAVSFLKLIGVIKDGNAEALKSIMQQMAMISEQLSDMDRKLDRLAEQMNEIQASAEFNARTEKAILFEKNWKDFEFRYMEDGLDNLITQYNSMMLKGLQAWCKNEGNDRIANGIDNTSLVLCYEKTENGYRLVYSTQNGRPDTAKEDFRILVLGSSILPKSVSWNVNTYRERIKKEIMDNIRNADDLSVLEAVNFPGFDSKEALNDELLGEIAEDAVNLLTYRTTAGQINDNSEFSLQVVRQFNNYCAHLADTNDGIDAITKVMFLTHAFEYQIADDYTVFMNQMAVKTGVYGSFLLTVMGMSDFVTDEEKLSALDLYCSSVLKIDQLKREGLTGNGNFCYLTNKDLWFGTISFTDSAEIKTKHRGSVNGYEGYKSNDTRVSVRYGLNNNACDASQLIGDSDALLLGYYLNGNHISFGYDFFNEKLGQSAAKDHGATVVSLIGPQSLPLNNGNTLAVTNVVGSYFSGTSTTRLSSLPSGASSGDIVFRRMMNGSLMNTASGSVSANNTLSAIAVYGESHWYWETDEAAFLGGPSDIGSMTNSCTKDRSGVDFPSTEYYTSSYTQTITYNCLINELPQHLTDSAHSSEILSSFAELCREIRESTAPKTPDEPKKTDFEGALPYIIIAAAVLVITIAAVWIVKKQKAKKQLPADK